MLYPAELRDRPGSLIGQTGPGRNRAGSNFGKPTGATHSLASCRLMSSWVGLDRASRKRWRRRDRSGGNEWGEAPREGWA